MDQMQLYLLTTLDMTVKMILSHGGLRVSGAFKLAAEFTGKIATPLYSQLDPIQLGQHARALDIGKQYAATLLGRTHGWSEDKARAVAQHLVHGYPSHGYILGVEELVALELPARQAEGAEASLLLECETTLTEHGDSCISLVRPSADTENELNEVDEKVRSSRAHPGDDSKPDMKTRSQRRKVPSDEGT